MTTGETIQEGPRISPTPAQKAARQILSTFWEKPPERQIQIGRDWLKLKQEQPQQCEEVRREEVQLGRQAWKELARLRDERARKVINILDSNKGNIVEGSRALRELREIALSLPENHPAADAIRSIYSHYAFQALILPGGIETAEPPEATVLQPTQTAPQPPAEPTEAPEVTAPIDQAERERQIQEARDLYLSVATPTLAESLAANIQIPPFAFRKDIADAIVSDAERTVRDAIATMGGRDSGAGIIYDFEVSRYLRGIIEGIGKGNRALVENQHREALEVLPAFLSRFPSTEAQERVNQAVLTLLGRRLLPALRAFQPETPASLRPRDTAEPQVETGGEASAPDPLLDRAREIAQEEGRLSVPRLQRELHIEYLQAARLMDTLEQEGLLPSEPQVLSRPIAAPPPAASIERTTTPPVEPSTGEPAEPPILTHDLDSPEFGRQLENWYGSGVFVRELFRQESRHALRIARDLFTNLYFENGQIGFIQSIDPIGNNSFIPYGDPRDISRALHAIINHINYFGEGRHREDWQRLMDFGAQQKGIQPVVIEFTDESFLPNTLPIQRASRWVRQPAGQPDRRVAYISINAGATPQQILQEIQKLDAIPPPVTPPAERPRGSFWRPQTPAPGTNPNQTPEGSPQQLTPEEQIRVVVERVTDPDSVADFMRFLDETAGVAYMQQMDGILPAEDAAHIAARLFAGKVSGWPENRVFELIENHLATLRERIEEIIPIINRLTNVSEEQRDSFIRSRAQVISKQFGIPPERIIDEVQKRQ